MGEGFERWFQSEITFSRGRTAQTKPNTKHIMGSGSFDPGAYRAFTTSSASKPTSGAGGVYSSSRLSKDLDPKGVKIRESRDSSDNPNATPIIVGIDVTGSMGMIADVIARQGLGTLFTEILDSKPISDPHIMFMAIGDANSDRAPLQVSQFEADNRIVDQLTQIYLEHGGGGNGWESYNLPWYFAARHTEHDSYIKRGKRGYLFTIGDEESPGPLTKDQITEFIGDTPERDLTSEELLGEAQRTYDVFHVIISEGSHASSYPDRVWDSWTKILGEHVVRLSDHKKLAECIVSIIEVTEGRDAKKVGEKFGGAVFDAVKHLPRSSRRSALLNA